MNNIVNDLVFVESDYAKLAENKQKLVDFLTNYLKNKSTIKDDENDDDDTNCYFALDINGNLVINPKTTGQPFLNTLSDTTVSKSNSTSLFELDNQYANNTCAVEVPIAELSEQVQSADQFANDLLKQYADIIAYLIKEEKQSTPDQLNDLLTDEARAFSISDYNKWLSKHLLELSQMNDVHKMFDDFRGKYSYTPNHVAELLSLCNKSANAQALFSNQKILHMLTDLIDNVYVEKNVKPSKEVLAIINTVKHNYIAD